MKKLMLMVVATGMVLVQGCGQKMFVKAGVSHEQAQLDLAQCKYEATRGSYTPMGRFDSPFMSGIQAGMQHNKLMMLCMQAKGYKLLDK